jgi:hypothetical protein
MGAMSIDELEVEVLKLDPASRARVAERLLDSLESLSEEENARLWAEEAARRDQTWALLIEQFGDESIVAEARALTP